MINLLTPPTRTSGSLGVTKVNVEPVDVEEEELSALEYNEAADWIILLRNAVAELETTDVVVIWQPGGTTLGNVFETAAELFAAVAEVRGNVKIFVDNTLSPTCQIPSGSYPLLCRELTFWSIFRPEVTILPGASFTGNTVCSLKIDNVTVDWRGTATSLFGLIEREIYVDLYRYGRLTSTSSTSAMFQIDEVGNVRMHGPQCQIDCTAGYELFKISDGCGINVFPDFFCSLNGNYARSSGTGANDGQVTVVYNADNANTIEPLQANLGGSYLKQDSRQYSDLDADTVVIWRPTEPSPTTGVFSSAASLLAAVSTKKGRVTIVIDTSLSSTCQIFGAAYVLACTELRFVSMSLAQLEIFDGVSFTGGTLRSFVVDGVQVAWDGSAPLVPATSTYFSIDLYRFGAIASNANASEMFRFSAGAAARIRLHDPECQIYGYGTYELFNVTAGCLVTIYKVSKAEVRGSFVRGLGSCEVIYDSTGGFDIETTQANVTSYTLTDTAQGGDLGPRLATAEADISILISNGTALSNGITALETPYAVASRRDETTNAYNWFLGAAIKLVRIQEATAKTVVTLDSSAWLTGNRGYILVDNIGGFGVEIVLADGAHTVNGQAAGVGYSLLPGSTQIRSATKLPAEYEVAYLGAGVWSIRAMIDLNDRLTTAEATVASHTSSIGTNTSDISALTTRVTNLEVPPALACDGGGGVHTKSWTTEREADVTDAVANYTIGLDASTGQWPVGESRPVNKLNLSAFTIALDPQPTHTINGVAAGTNVLLMNSDVIPSATLAAGIWRVKRLSTTAWWVQ